MLWGEFKSKQARIFILLVLILALVLRVWISWQPVPTLLEKNLPDDSYYYFVLARNTVQLGNVGLDGINTTNGFHPLWWLMLLPIFGIPPQVDDTHVHLALSLGSILDLLAIYFIAQIGSLVTKRELLGAIAAALYAFNPMVFLQTTNGLETALGMALLTAFWFVTVKWINRPYNSLQAVILGLCAGLLFLARSDSSFFVALTFLAIFIYLKPKESWKTLLIAGIVAGVVCLPWLLWSKLTVGSWLQESGVAVPHANYVRLEIQSGAGFIPVIREVFRQLTAANFWLRGDPTGLPLVMGIGLWLILLIGLGIRWWKKTDWYEIFALAPIFIAGAIMIIFHAGIRWYPRPWYFVPTAGAFAVGFSLLIKPVHVRTWRAWAVTALVLLGFLLSGVLIWQAGFYPWQREMLQAANWIRRNLPSNQTIGSFNSGIYAYYWDGVVVNLDGVVNHRAFEAIRDKREICYMIEEQIDYLLDYDSAIRREYAPFMGPGFPDLLIENAILGGEPDGALGALRIYQIDKLGGEDFCSDQG